nr:MAG TPA: hypothetical protein [Caudoviricetes sp.]
MRAIPCSSISLIIPIRYVSTIIKQGPSNSEEFVRINSLGIICFNISYTIIKISLIICSFS